MFSFLKKIILKMSEYYCDPDEMVPFDPVPTSLKGLLIRWGNVILVLLVNFIVFSFYSLLYPLLAVGWLACFMAHDVRWWFVRGKR